jgi:hypothetical protein
MDDQEKYDAYAEAVRLIHKFFPESRSVFLVESRKGRSRIGIDFFIEAMVFCGLKSDFSSGVQIPPGPDLGLDKKGGFQGEYDEVLDRLLSHTNFSPSGRAVIIPDVTGQRAWSRCRETPFVCDCKMAGHRLVDLDSEHMFLGTSYDSLIVFESGEALAIDHDNRFFWAKSKKNRFGKTAENNG